MSATVILWFVPGLYLLCLGGLTYFILQSFRSAATDYAAAYSESTSRQMEDLFLFIPAKRVLELALASSAICFLIGFPLFGGADGSSVMTGAGFGAVLAALGWTIPRTVLAVMRKRRLQRFNFQLVDSLVNMSNALKAGFSVQQAIELVVREGQNPLAQEFGMFLHQTRVGMRLEEAFDGMQKRVGSDDLVLMVAALETARQTGGNLTEVFEKIAHTIRERLRIEMRIRTLTAQGRLQGVIVGAMPLLLAMALFVLDPAMMMTFLRSGFGITLLVVVALLEGVGALVIHRIIRIDI
ncbi:MAG: type II secretion system F family protein [bacterium]